MSKKVRDGFKLDLSEKGAVCCCETERHWQARFAGISKISS
jgi:hypothetical protein